MKQGEIKRLDAVTKKDLRRFESRREETHQKSQKKLLKNGKIDKQLNEALRKINNSSCYEYFDNPEHRSFHNMLQFLALLDRKCELFYGNKKKFKKYEVEDVLKDTFPDPTEIQRKTIKVIHKVVKKGKHPELGEFRFNGLLKSAYFDPDEIHIIDY